MSAQHQSAEVKARANQTKNQVLSHPYVQQGAAVANQYAVRLDKHVSTIRSIRRTSPLSLTRDFAFRPYPQLSQYPILNKAEEKTRIPKVYGVLSTAGAFIFLIFFNLFGLASPLSNLIGWAIPAYLSVQALESPGKNDDKQWLTYWVSFPLSSWSIASQMKQAEPETEIAMGRIGRLRSLQLCRIRRSQAYPLLLP